MRHTRPGAPSSSFILRHGLSLTCCALIATGCAGGGKNPALPGSPASAQSVFATLIADSPVSAIADITLDERSILGKHYIYDGVAPNSVHTITVIPEPGAELTVAWSLEADSGQFATGTTAEGLTLTWTAPGTELAEARIRSTITSTAGVVERFWRINVQTAPPVTDEIHPQPLSDVLLHDPAPRPGDASDYMVAQDEMLITLKPGLGDAGDIERFFASMGTQVTFQLVRRPIYRVFNTEGGDLWAKIQAFRALDFVEIAEPNPMRYLFVVPNDPAFNQQYCHTTQHAIEGWDVGKGDPNQIIAIMDTGTGRQHPDLAAKCVDGADFITPQGDGLGGDTLGDGVDNNGRNGVDEGVGHGVHCSGIAAAISDNGVGGAGMSWNSKLMGLRIFPIDGDSGASGSSILSAVNYITDYNNNAGNTAKIVACNQSFGGGGFSQTEQNALNAAINSGCTFAAAAGNDNVSTPFYPANYENSIAIAAVNNNDVRAGFSNYGTWIDVSAAGVSIYNTYLHGPPGTPPASANIYGSLSGTSMAAPQVAGLIGLIKGNAPDMTPAEVREQILGTADNIDAQNPSYAGRLGTGRINVFEALTRDFSIDLISSGAITLNDSHVGFGQGNRDGIINPGERVLVLPQIQNIGLRGATNVELALDAPADPFLKFAAETITVTSITRVDGMSAGAAFPLVVAPNTPDNYEATFDYVASVATGTDGPWNFSFTVRVEKDSPAADTIPVVAGDLTEGVALRPSANKPFFSLDLAGDADYLTIHELTVTLQGTVDPAAIANVRLWADNGNGTFEGPFGDIELGLLSYWNASYHNNFDRQGDPSAKLGRPQDRNVYVADTLNGSAATFHDLRIPVPDSGNVRLFLSADIAREAAADSTIGFTVMDASDVIVSAGDTLTGFPWGSATVPVKPTWDPEAQFAFAGSSQGWRAKAAMDDSGHIYVVYDACCFPDFDIFLRKSDDGGETWGTETAIITHNANDFYPDVAVGDAGKVYVSWYNTRHGNNNREIYFKMSSDFGATFGSDIRVTNQSRNSRVPRILYGDNRIHIVWFDDVTAFGDYNIYYTSSDNDGASWSTFETVSNTPSNRVAEEPQIALAGTTLYSAWYEYIGSFGNPGNSHRVVYNYKPSAGVWQTPRVITDPAELAYGVKISPTSDGKIYTAYHSDSAGDFDVWLQVLDEGTTESTEAVTVAGGASTFPDIHVSANGRLDVVYQDSFGGDSSNIFHVWRPDDASPWETTTQLSQNSGGLSDTAYLIRDESTENMWAWWNDSRPAGTHTWYSALRN